MKKLFIAVILTILGLNILNAKEVANTAKTTEKDPIVVLQTSAGNIELRLFPKAAPLAVKNFMTHAKNGYYNGIIFHRVIKGFMIQGGDPTGTGMGGESIWKKDFQNEYAPNLTFDRPFLLAMANAGPNTNGSQFFITTAATPFLNGGYTIFGEVINGKEVVKKIENAKTSPEDRPYTKQIIKKAFVK
ncbi:MAG: peptidylprolyl isomerase [Sulfurovaceae bacterium]